MRRKRRVLWWNRLLRCPSKSSNCCLAWSRTHSCLFFSCHHASFIICRLLWGARYTFRRVTSSCLIHSSLHSNQTSIHSGRRSPYWQVHHPFWSAQRVLKAPNSPWWTVSRKSYAGSHRCPSHFLEYHLVRGPVHSQRSRPHSSCSRCTKSCKIDIGIQLLSSCLKQLS